MSSGVSSNYEVAVSELFEYLEKIFLLCYMNMWQCPPHYHINVPYIHYNCVIHSYNYTLFVYFIFIAMLFHSDYRTSDE